MEKVRSYVLPEPKENYTSSVVGIRVLVYLLSMPARDLELLWVRARQIALTLLNKRYSNHALSLHVRIME